MLQDTLDTSVWSRSKPTSKNSKQLGPTKEKYSYIEPVILKKQKGQQDNFPERRKSVVKSKGEAIESA